MNKHDYEYQRAVISSTNLAEGLRLAKHGFTCLLIFGCTYLLFDFFKACLASPAPVLNAFATIADKFKLGSTLGYLWGGFASAAWALERRGKKRAIQLKGRYQAEVEKGETNRTSSGLNHRGEISKVEGL